jgi:hypothetical protein
MNRKGELMESDYYRSTLYIHIYIYTHTHRYVCVYENSTIKTTKTVEKERRGGG